MNSNKFQEISTDLSNPEQDNQRYYRTRRQRKFPSPALKDPQYHTRSSNVLLAYLHSLIDFRIAHPKLALFLKYAVPILLMLAMAFICFVLPALVPFGSVALLAIQISGTLIATVLALVFIRASQFICDRVIGTPHKAFESLYKEKIKAEEQEEIEIEQQERSFSYGTATGTLSLTKGFMPQLHIKAQNHSDAGYVEGYMQAEQIEISLKRILHVYLDAYRISDAKLGPYLQDIERTIPPYYIEEMKAKVAGYNAWRREKGLSKRGDLHYYKYLLLQLLPDAQDYSPFRKLKSVPDQAVSEIDAVSNFGCSTVAFKINEYTCYVRILDWAAFDIAGKAFIEVTREIEGFKKTKDASFCVLSGAITTINEDQLLTQINVSNVEQTGPKGMPGVFMIRYLAENCSSVAAMRNLLSNEHGEDPYVKQGPLSGMHVSATDGKEACSYHAYQGEEGGHIFERLGERPLVVTNFGYNPKTKKLSARNDSSQRLENINRFFKDHPRETVLQEGMTEENKLQALREYMLQIMRLDLVNNFKSVFAGMYIYKSDPAGEAELVDAHAATDNLYAGSRTLDEFYNIRPQL